jgi:hypothetical protein
MLTGLGGIFDTHSNPNLTSITNPVSSNVFTFYIVHSCNLSTLDVSGLTGLGNQFQANLNPNLTSITNPVSTQIFFLYDVNSCNLSTLDVSGLSNLGGTFRAHTNPNLTSITNPVSPRLFASYHAYSCNISFINFLPLSNLTNFNGVSIRLENNGMTSVNVDQTFIDLDSISVGGFTSRSIRIDGTNAAATATSLTARNNLIANGFTLIHN